MATQRFRTHLTLMGRGDPVVAAARRDTDAALALAPLPFPTAAAFTRDELCDVATRRGLLERLELVAGIAPTAPLSFVVVKVYGLAELNEQRGREAGNEVLRGIADELRGLTRPTDLVGRLTGTTFAVVLQGTGATAAAAVQARLQHRVSQLPVVSHPIEVAVSAATGIGLNADTLPLAAMDSFEDCG
jgi:diguanylate cyclase (GGDEF)-like protein